MTALDFLYWYAIIYVNKGRKDEQKAKIVGNKLP